ncbi:MAG TPA: CoA transferase [Candidatus Bipolaricaulis anaerobius]|nr:CoA transferase [Candidatus Bipolaricaulis anaerobius]
MRVLDLSRILAGPLATMWMADLGAEVIKVERPGTGDETRRWGPPFVGGESAYFLAVNRGKLGISLDLGRDREALEALIRTSDVLVHNFLPKTLATLSLAYPNVQELNPRLVYTAVAGFPPGPYRHEPGFDALIQALGGLMAITGDGDRPVKVGVAIVDVLAAWAALAGTLAALLSRTKTGRGQAVETTLIECSAAGLANVSQAFLLTGVEPERRWTAHPHIVPYQAFPARDGLLMVAVGTDAQFQALCSALRRPDLATDPRFATNPDRVRNRDELVELLAKIFQSRSRAEWTTVLKGAGVPAGPVNTLRDLFGDPGLVGRLLVEVNHPTVGRYMSIGCPMSVAWPPSPLPPPRLGEHTDDVLKRLGIGS